MIQKCCVQFSLAFVLTFLLLSGCSNTDSAAKVLAEGIHDEFLRVELKSPFETTIASCRKRPDGSGVDLFLINDKSLIKGVEVPVEQKSERVMVDIKWSLFGDDKRAVWLDGIDNLGEWKVDSPGE